MITLYSILLSIIAFSAYAVMYVLQFRYHVSIFSKWNEMYWNPTVSDLNKWKLNGKEIVRDKNGKRKERFIGSSTIFVFLTDAWHLFQFVFENSFMLAIAINYIGASFYISFVALRILYGIFFNVLFDKVLILKKYRDTL